MTRHEIRWWTEYDNGTETHTLTCDVEGCGWEIAVTEATAVGARRAAREHTELRATIKAKQENDERFMLERDEARQRIAELQREVAFLDALEAAGVDNWEGYEEARRIAAEASDE